MAVPITEGAVILRMRNVITVARWATCLECARPERKINKLHLVQIGKSDTPQSTYHSEGKENTPGREQGLGAYSLFSLDSKLPLQYKVQLSVGEQTLEMEIETGASL